MDSRPPFAHTAAVIGAGAWGTTLARHLAETGMEIRLWAFEPEVVEAIRCNRENSLYLPGIPLPSRIFPTASLEEAVQDTGFWVIAVPSHAMRPVLTRLNQLLPSPVPVIIATKGMEEGSLKFMSEVLTEVLPPSWAPGITVLTGPSFATEVCRGKPTTLLLAGQDPELTIKLQSLFMTPHLRIYTGSDLIGAQLGGALKNVMAIAAGLVDGLDLGLNARAALVTRGLAEMLRLGAALGADVHTLYGLSGLGDLVLTCTGPLSRNYTVGYKLGKGLPLSEILQQSPTVAEGVRTTQVAVDLANQLNVEMPISQGVHGILFEGKHPKQVVTDLMARAAKGERDLLLTKHSST